MNSEISHHLSKLLHSVKAHHLAHQHHEHQENDGLMLAAEGNSGGTLPSDFDKHFIDDFIRAYLWSSSPTTINDDPLPILRSMEAWISSVATLSTSPTPNMGNRSSSSSEIGLEAMLAVYIRLLTRALLQLSTTSASLQLLLNPTFLQRHEHRLFYGGQSSYPLLRELAVELLTAMVASKPQLAIPFSAGVFAFNGAEIGGLKEGSSDDETDHHQQQQENFGVLEQLFAENTSLVVRRAMEGLAAAHLKSLLLHSARDREGGCVGNGVNSCSPLKEARALCTRIMSAILQSDFTPLLDTFARLLLPLISPTPDISPRSDLLRGGAMEDEEVQPITAPLLDLGQKHALLCHAKSVRRSGADYCHLVATLALHTPSITWIDISRGFDTCSATHAHVVGELLEMISKQEAGMAIDSNQSPLLTSHKFNPRALGELLLRVAGNRLNLVVPHLGTLVSVVNGNKEMGPMLRALVESGGLAQSRLCSDGQVKVLLDCIEMAEKEAEEENIVDGGLNGLYAEAIERIKERIMVSPSFLKLLADNDNHGGKEASNFTSLTFHRLFSRAPNLRPYFSDLVCNALSIERRKSVGAESREALLYLQQQSAYHCDVSWERRDAAIQIVELCAEHLELDAVRVASRLIELMLHDESDFVRASAASCLAKWWPRKLIDTMSNATSHHNNLIGANPDNREMRLVLLGCLHQQLQQFPRREAGDHLDNELELRLATLAEESIAEMVNTAGGGNVDELLRVVVDTEMRELLAKLCEELLSGGRERNQRENEEKFPAARALWKGLHSREEDRRPNEENSRDGVVEMSARVEEMIEAMSHSCGLDECLAKECF